MNANSSAIVDLEEMMNILEKTCIILENTWIVINRLLVETSMLKVLPVSVNQFIRSVMSDCKLMDCSTPGFPVHHQLPELAQTHVHWVGDATTSED